MDAPRTRVLIVLGVVLVAVAATVVVLVGRGSSSPSVGPTSGASASGPVLDATCRRVAAQTRAMVHPLPLSGGRRVDVLGDSYSVGVDLDRPTTETWDVLLAAQQRWDLTVRGIGGTGFVNAGRCGAQTYATRVPQVLADRPELLIVQGGLNDVGRPGVQAAATALLAALPSSLPVVVVGPSRAPARSAAGEAAVDRELRAAVATSARARYVSTLDWPLAFDAGRVHLTVAGHATYARLLAAELDR